MNNDTVNVNVELRQHWKTTTLNIENIKLRQLRQHRSTTITNDIGYYNNYDFQSKFNLTSIQQLEKLVQQSVTQFKVRNDFNSTPLYK